MGKNKRIARIIITIVAVIVLIFSVGAVAYPFVSNYLSDTQALSAISTYQVNTDSMEADKKAELLAQAQMYNSMLGGGTVLDDPFSDSGDDSEDDEYNQLLATDDTGVMSFIEIPSINVYLPIYHGTDSSALERGVGHLKGSSLPIGGIGTHCVLSGHTGLNKARLLTDLVDVKEGDQFYIHTLGETLAYQVDQIKVVLPSDTSDLGIESDKDYVTLVTCTPYGVNTHRLLVRGVRVEYNPEAATQTAENTSSAGSTWIQECLTAFGVSLAIVVLLALLYYIFLFPFVNRKRREKERQERREKKASGGQWSTFRIDGMENEVSDDIAFATDLPEKVQAPTQFESDTGARSKKRKPTSSKPKTGKTSKKTHRKKQLKLTKKHFKILGTIVLFIGLLIFVMPDIYSAYVDYQANKNITAFEDHYNVGNADSSELSGEEAEKVTEEEAEKQELYDRVVEYNEELYETSQEGLVDAWSLAQPSIDLGLEDDLFGYIKIPAMDVKLPLYFGASESHMASGAVILGQTSLPIGGENTNSVVAGHRGYQGAPYFREIENLKEGDKVIIQNPWERLTYKVVDIEIIEPDDSEKILIQEGKDMVTLMTCHPYRSQGKYRYLVYCERVETNAGEDEDEVLEGRSFADQVFDSSAAAIERENQMRVIMAGAIIILLIFTLLPSGKQLQRMKLKQEAKAMDREDKYLEKKQRKAEKKKARKQARRAFLVKHINQIAERLEKPDDSGGKTDENNLNVGTDEWELDQDAEPTQKIDLTLFDD